MLSENWITENTTDFEYKKYIALGYLKSAYKSFTKGNVYPELIKIRKHIRSLSDFVKNECEIHDTRPSPIVGIDLNKKEIVREPVERSKLSQDVLQIVRFALPLFKKAEAEGAIVKSRLLNQFTVQPIGIIPIYQQEGFLFVEDKSTNATVYRYNFLPIEQTYKYTIIDRLRVGVARTYNSAKMMLSKRENMPCPASYIVQSSLASNSTSDLLAREMFETYHYDYRK